MRKLLKYSIFICFAVCQVNTTIAQLDSTKESLSIYAKSGLAINYPYISSWGNSHYDLFGQIGEVGLNISIERVQLGLGLGYFSVFDTYKNSSYIQSQCKHHFFVPISCNVRIFNLKRNLFSIKGGISFFLPFLEVTNVDTVYPNYRVSSISSNQLKGFGISAVVGLKYSRQIGKRLLLSLETDFGFCLYNQTYFETPDLYNSATYYPGNTLQFGMEYFFGKKHPKYLGESIRKKR